MNVFWLEQTEADVPAGNDWLSVSERARCNGMRILKRRTEWRLGRWTAKRAVAAYLNLPGKKALTAIEVHPAPSGAPEVFLPGEPAPATISLSHRAGTCVCAVTRPGAALGCDLELIEPRSESFIADYFTPEEQEIVARAPAAHREQMVCLLWSAKESALKALHEGLRLDTRCVVATASIERGEGWHQLQAYSVSGEIFRGWWRNTGNLLRTVVASPVPDLPIPLTPMPVEWAAIPRVTL